MHRIIRILDHTLSFCLFYSGLNWLYERFAARNRNIPIIFYHEIRGGIDGDMVEFSVEKSNFEKQIQWFSSRYDILPVDELVRRIQNGTHTTARKPAAVTFDGGYAGNYHHAYPALKRYNVPATVYVTADAIDGRVPWERKLLYIIISAVNKSISCTISGKRYTFPVDTFENKIKAKEFLRQEMANMNETEREKLMSQLSVSANIDASTVVGKLFLSWKQIIEMDAGGLITIGSHSSSHPRLTEVPQEIAIREICGSKQRLEEKLGNKITSFCYPDGFFSDEIIAQVKKAGYSSSLAVSTPDAPNDLNSIGDDVYKLRRICMPDTSSRACIAVNVSGLMRTVKNRMKVFLGSIGSE